MSVVFIGSPNFSQGRGGKPISLIVVHHTAGTLAGADAVFQDTVRNTSAHYGVGRGGEVHQYVLEEDTAFQAGVYDINQRSVGIEHEDLNADDYTDIEYQTSAALIREICIRYNLPINANTIQPHRAFVATACPGSLDISRLIELAQTGEATVNISKQEYDDLKEWKRKAVEELTPALADATAWKTRATNELLPLIEQLKQQLADQGTVLAPGNYVVK